MRGTYKREERFKMKALFFPLLLLVEFKFCLGTLSIDEFCQVFHELPENFETRPLLYLMPSLDGDVEHEAINEKFKDWAYTLGFTTGVIEISPECELGYYKALEITEALSKKYEVINLKVNIPPKYFEKITEDHNPIGFNIFPRKKWEDIWKCNNNSLRLVNGSSYETCHVTKELITKNYTKLISRSIQNYTLLYEYLHRIDDDNVIVPRSMPIKKHSTGIVICANKLEHDCNIRTGTRRINQIIEDCKNVDDFDKYNILAVIAPKPFQNEENTNLPVVFYDTPYLLPQEKVIYPKSTTLYSDYFNKVTQNILKYIKSRYWHRVAIVSDYSPNSNIFEENMSDLFNKHDVVYTVQQCLGLNCDFTKSLTWLKEVDARVIIANVGKKYAKNLVDAAAYAKLTGFDNVLWIFRDWPLDKDIQCHALQALGEFAVVSPKNSGITHDSPECRISKAIEYIEAAIDMEEMPKTDDDFLGIILRSRPRLNMKKIEKDLQYDTTVEVNTITTGVHDKYCNNPKRVWKAVEYFDIGSTCCFRSYKFESPCEDMYPLMILLVILGFLLSVLSIVVFFKNCTLYGENYCAL